MNIQKALWGSHRERLLKIIKQTEKRNNHRFADEIDKALSEGRAFLFIGQDGFFVLEPLSSKGLVRINVMFAFNWGGDAINRYQTMIERLAREAGARSLELYTAVKGLVPLLEQHQWRMTGDEPVMHWVKTL
ncbi:Uncharacterised protein [Photobacterium damselae]|uniref:hypothetical protein n=1 Tax=Photobacterium damselae TaxID=38293 RepID=UPI000DFA61A9|nr:Uncharacterised protein [Photobacterium damselae]